MKMYIKNTLQNTTAIWLCFAFWLLTGSKLQAQKIPAAIAPFKITMANGQSFSAAQLQKNKPTALIYFDPDCDHCVLFTKELLKQYKGVRNKQIIMVTYRPLPIIKDFENLFKLSSYPSIKMGTEMETFIVRKYYSIYTFPFIALYNSNGKAAGIYNEKMDDAAGIKMVVGKVKQLN